MKQRKIIFMKGLPGSGKTTWAKNLINKNPNKYKRINKDDLRGMLDNSNWNKENEKFILQVRDSLIGTSICSGYDVIIDDTNLHHKHLDKINELAKRYNAEVELKDFTTVPIETCIKNDLKRPKSVGERVIKQMHKQFLVTKKDPPEFDWNKKDAIICDMDGTLAIMNGRSPFEWDKVITDDINLTIKNIVDTFKQSGYELLIVSGRDEICREDTAKWLDMFEIRYDQLFMRPHKNNEKDTNIKKYIYDNFIKDKYNIEFVLDDRNSVVELWRSLGLICLQVADGYF